MPRGPIAHLEGKEDFIKDLYRRGLGKRKIARMLKCGVAKVVAIVGGEQLPPTLAGRKGGLACQAARTPEQRSALGRKGGLAANVKLTREQRVERAREAAYTRRRRSGTLSGAANEQLGDESWF